MSGIKACALLRGYKESVTLRLSYATSDQIARAVKKLNNRDVVKSKKQAWTTSHFIRAAIDRYAREILEDEGSEGQREVPTGH